MLVLLDKSLDDLVNEESASATDTLLEQISHLTFARRQGRLILVFESNNLVDYLLKSSKVTQTSKAVIIHVDKLRATKKELLKKLNTRIRVVKDGSRISIATSSSGINEIIAPIGAVPYGLFNFPVLLSENALDSDAYLVLTKMAIAAEPKELPPVRVNAETRGGGGSQVFSEYKRSKKQGDRLTLCVIDSDVTHPTCIGNSWGRRMLDHDIESPYPLTYAKLINVYSIENLIPLSSLGKIPPFSDPAGAYRLASELPVLHEHARHERWRYIPLKKGISCKFVRGKSEAARYWKAECSTFTLNFNEQDCKKGFLSCSRDCQLIPTYPDALLENFIKHYVRDHEVPDLAAEFRGIPEIVKAHVREIASLIAAWCCVSAPIPTASRQL